MSVTGIPVTADSPKNPAVNSSETRFDIVIVNRSLDAAKTISDGNTRIRAASMMTMWLSAPLQCSSMRVQVLSVDMKEIFESAFLKT